MPDRSTNRSMFWRIVRRLLGANRGRLFVILLALGAGAAVTAALLNLQLDAKRRLTTEFRTLGTNILVSPLQASESPNRDQTLDQSILQKVPRALEGQRVSVLAALYLSADAYAPGSQAPSRVVVAGALGDFESAAITGTASPSRVIVVSTPDPNPSCWVGVRVAARLHLKVGDDLSLKNDGKEQLCRIEYVRSVGGPEDDQVQLNLDLAQRLASLPGRIGLIQISAPGTPAAIERYVADLQAQLPDANVRPIRQFTEAEAKIYNRISGLLTATVALVLVLTALCVMAAMTNVAMERKNDVGLMKALGGATRRVLRLFLAEAAVLGLVGGALGAAAGIVLSIGLGQAVFGVAARPRLIVYPISVALTILVAIAGAYPLRRLAGIRPASVFRGEA